MHLKYVKKIPETNIELSNNLKKQGWIKIKEPKNVFIAILTSLPLMIVLSGFTISFTYILKPELFNLFMTESMSFVINIDLRFILFILVLFVYMFLHEMIHAICIPNFVNSDKIFWGINGLFGFVFTTEPIRKGRFIIVSCAPFLLLTIGALIIFDLTGLLNGYTFSLCFLNAAGSCTDFLNALLITFQVKKRRKIISNGFETFYNPFI